MSNQETNSELNNDAYPFPSDLDVVNISESFRFPLNAFTLPSADNQYMDHIMIPEGMINSRSQKLAERILSDYDGKELYIIVIMAGAFKFYSDLFTHLNQMMQYSNKRVYFKPIFCKLSSYMNTESTGKLHGLKGLDDASIKGKHVLIVEDMYDSGNTMIKLLEKVHELEPDSVKVAVAFHKKTHRNLHHNYFADYLGFLIPDEFVVGYGLDYNEHFRDVFHVCVLNQDGVDAFKDATP